MVELLKKHWYVFVVIFLIGSIFIYPNSSKNKNVKGDKIFKVKKEVFKESLTLSGEISAEEKTTLRFQTSGRLTWVGVKVGDYVKKYQALASLDQRETQKNLEKALRDYSKERRDFEEDKEVTYKSSVKTDTVRRILEKNQFDLEKAVLDVELKQLAVELSTLTSPIEGIVTKISSPYAGVNVTPAQAEIEIVNPNTVYFSAVADQTEVAQIKKDLQGEIVLDSYPDEKIQGSISNISFTPKEGETGTVYEVKVIFSKDNSDYTYRLGMTGDVNFAIGQSKKIIIIPTSFIKVENKKKYVLVGDQKIKTNIKTGKTIDSSVEVISGLKEGDTIYD